MNRRRRHLVNTVQALAREEADRQPSAAAWLEAQDAQAGAHPSAEEGPSDEPDGDEAEDGPGPTGN